MKYINPKEFINIFDLARFRDTFPRYLTVFNLSYKLSPK